MNGPFRVLRGNPSEEELAALIIALATLTAGESPDEPRRDRVRWLTPPVRHRGPNAWRRGLTAF
ncbi:acyl-CoA carboxylase subunit epsilon [Micromonospora eburnea]|uniref:Acyl-CoA carboxylase epsilon subunit n=1 Tax=Micromonospora eburnea TaxID=227316 RepID=A0A1C6UJF4_9ACTN|nr:acyl-CoA carboxylase subunit epsilon [Micromonospora eburnea]SCL54029.1 Acyl-CoA carboxylase epsilon subunit [Micromonospora eburnea]